MNNHHLMGRLRVVAALCLSVNMAWRIAAGMASTVETRDAGIGNTTITTRATIIIVTTPLLALWLILFLRVSTKFRSEITVIFFKAEFGAVRKGRGLSWLRQR